MNSAIYSPQDFSSSLSQIPLEPPFKQEESTKEKIAHLALQFFQFGLNVALFFSNPILWVCGATVGVIERPRIQIYSKRVIEFWDRNKTNFIQSCLFAGAAAIALAVVWPITVFGYAAHTTSKL